MVASANCGTEGSRRQALGAQREPGDGSWPGLLGLRRVRHQPVMGKTACGIKSMSRSYRGQEEYLSIKYSYMPILLWNIDDKKAFLIERILNEKYINRNMYNIILINLN
jgi:hypothetical protein